MPTLRLTLTALTGIPMIQAGDDLAPIIRDALVGSGLSLQTDDVLVIAQKIVSKAEGRSVDLRGVVPSPQALELAPKVEKDPRLVELILSESTEVIRHRPGVLVVAHRLGYVLANAGIDHSNVEPAREAENVLLLPADPDRTCAKLRERLWATTAVRIGVIINDSHGRAWRIGTVGLALGAAGLPAVLDLRGTPDLFDSSLEVTQVGLADELAAAASVMMGQAAEGRPVVHIRGVPYASREGNAGELIRPEGQDLFR